MSTFKKFVSVMLCALGIVMLAACSFTDGKAVMPNPFIDCSDMKAAANVSGFEMTAPKTANGYEQSKIQAVQGDMIQVIYGDDDNNVYIRKIAKSAVSGKDAFTTATGDYNDYSYSSGMTVGKINVTVKGTASDKLCAAAWKDGKYYYAVTVTGNTIIAKTVEALVQAVK